MRHAACFLVLGAMFVAASVVAADEILRRQVTLAEHELEIAQLALRQYERVEYPLQLERLESEITLAKARIAALEGQLAEYEQFNKFTGSNPLFLTRQQTRLALLEARLELKNLETERRLLQQARCDQVRLHTLEIEVARERLALARAELARQ